IGTIDPAIETRWRNQIVSYDQLQLDDEDVGLLQAFDDMMERIKFVPPETSSQYFENDDLNAMKIVTNRNGIKIYKARLRAGNESFRMQQDPSYTMPVFDGIPIKHIDELNRANLDQNALVNSSV